MPKKSARRGWRDIQSKKHRAKLIRLGLLGLISLVIILLISYTVKFTQMIFSPWSISTAKTYSWTGDFNINIVLLAKDTALLSFDPKEEKITILNIPPNTYLEASFGFGKWQLSSIYDFGQSQSIGGGRLIKSSLQNFFGLPIDGFIYFSGKGAASSSDFIVSEIRKNPLSAVSILPYIKTDLSPWELIRFRQGLSSVRFDKIKSINLEKSFFFQKDRLADGTEIFIADLVRLDTLISGMPDSKIRSEGKTIAIFNTTETPGLAQKASRLISNLGGNVIIISNSDENLEKTAVLGDKSKTTMRLKQIFGDSGTIEAGKDQTRADINIFLGHDFADSL